MIRQSDDLTQQTSYMRVQRPGYSERIPLHWLCYAIVGWSSDESYPRCSFLCWLLGSPDIEDLNGVQNRGSPEKLKPAPYPRPISRFIPFNPIN